MEQEYFNNIKQFGKANKNNAATLYMLTATNTQIATNIAAAVHTLQQQMEQLALSVNTKATAAPPSFRQNNYFVPQQHYVPMPPQQ